MKASELMIGDLVKTNKGDIIKVESISTKRQHRKAGYHTKDDTTHIKYVRQGQIEPISLTPEILEANGWKLLSNFDREAYYSKDGEFNLNVHNGRLRLFINSCVVTIEYVHELQHALRLCGLTELADNFKIN